MLTRLLLMPVLLLSSYSAQSATIVFDTSSLSAGQKMLATFYIESLLPWNFTGKTIQTNTITIACDNLSANECSVFGDMTGENGSLNFSAAQKTWMHNYLETRSQRHNHHIIPDTLEEFAEQSQYRTWPQKTIDSRIKRAKRVIYHGKLDGRKVSVAETLSDSNEFREAEIVVEAKREAGTFDFYVYLHDGKIALESEFPAGMKPAPLICVNCHMNGANQKTDRFISNRQ